MVSTVVNGNDTDAVGAAGDAVMIPFVLTGILPMRFGRACPKNWDCPKIPFATKSLAALALQAALDSGDSSFKIGFLL